MGVRETEIANINLTNKSYPAGVFLFFLYPMPKKKKKHKNVFNELAASEIFMGKICGGGQTHRGKLSETGKKKKTSYCVMSLGNGG